MYLSGVVSAEEKYGRPTVHRMAFPMRVHEFVLLRRSMRWGRAHDTTAFILDQSQVVVIRKPSYPTGVYRPPSGGVHPGETLEEGTLREAYEETGLRVQLNNYLLKVFVDFYCSGEHIPWTTHVFTADVIGGSLDPVDKREILEARWVPLEALATSARDALLAAGSFGLVYRAHLQCRALEALWKEKVNADVSRIQEDFMD